MNLNTLMAVIAASVVAAGCAMFSGVPSDA